MGMVLNTLKWLGIFLVLVVIAVLGLPQLPGLQDSVTGGKAKAYLAEHAVTLDFEKPDAGLEFPEELYGKRLITLHEIHGYADLQFLDFAMMRHLHRRTGWRVYLGEMSPAQAIAFNDYVLGGSDLPARSVFDAWADKNAQWANQEFFRKLTAIRTLNEQLPEDRRIVFIGVDLLGRDEASDWLDGRPIPASAPHFSSTAGIRAINYVLLQDAKDRTPETRYGEILQNIDMVLSFPGAERERFYALWGLFHGGQVATSGSKTLAMYLAEEGGPFEGDMATIGTLCISECMNMMPSEEIPAALRPATGEAYTLLPMTFDNAYLVRVRGLPEIQERLGNARAMVVPLRLDGSPYKKGPRLAEQTGFLAMLVSFDYDGSAADVFDAMIIHRNSQGLTPWRGEAYDATDPS